MSKENPLALKDNKRSLFSVGAVELGFSILVGVTTWFGLSQFLHTTLPYPCGNSVAGVLVHCGWTEQQAWETLGEPLFSAYAVPLVLVVAISSIFMIRSIRKDVRHFSLMGNLALSVPIFTLFGFFFLSFLSYYCFPLGLVLSFMATVYSVEEKKYGWTWVSLPFNLAWLFIFGSFLGKFLDLYGD